MLTYSITGDNINITARERAYIEKRFHGFHRFITDDAPREISITATKTTAHQREDSVRVEVKFKIGQKDFFATGEGADIVGAADQAKGELMREVTHNKQKSITLFHRGARRLKGIIKAGKKKRN